MSAPKRKARTAEPAAPLAVAAKLCGQCHESKPRTAFWPTASTNDKLTGKCKACIGANAARDRAEREARQAEIEKRAKAAEPPSSKRCITCKVSKPLSEFAPHAQAKDGRRRSCRTCVAEARVQRKAVSPMAKEAERKRRAQPHRKEANGKAVRAWKEQHPEAERAMRAVRLAIKAGQLARSPRCQVKRCRYRGRLQGHHFDYAHPLAVIWCCPAHHRRLHAGEKLEVANGLPAILAQVPASVSAAQIKQHRKRPASRSRAVVQSLCQRNSFEPRQQLLEKGNAYE